MRREPIGSSVRVMRRHDRRLLAVASVPDRHSGMRVVVARRSIPWHGALWVGPFVS